ncbi:MAG TPA: hypothetical protein VFH97_08410 [Gemmatimonadales bacterium]|nr:hypothetical protein [Gemmatimonadales bacterium]
MRPSTLSLLVAGLVVGLPAQARAQDLSTLITDLFTFGDCGQPLCLDLGNEHGEHFIPSVTQGSRSVIGFLTQSIGKSTANLPISATSSGTTFRIVGGLPVKTSTSAGPIYAERSQTLGRGRFFVGANVSGISFTTLNGAPVEDLAFNFAHEDVGAAGLGDPEFENDMITTRLSLDVDVQVAALFATWGVLDFVDLGVAIPFVRTSIQGASEAQITPFGPNAIHNFNGDIANPVLRAATSVRGSAAGIGDIVGRVKVNLGQGSKAGAAIMGDVRFPTAREEDLLGSGSTSIRALAIFSAQFGNFAPHVNGGYAARTDTLQNDAVLATLGFDALVAPWATVAFDVVSEWQVGDSKVVLPDPIVYTIPFDRQYPSTSIPSRRENAIQASLGAKFTMRGGMVLVVNGLVPMRKVGLQPDYLWTAGLEYAF